MGELWDSDIHGEIFIDDDGTFVHVLPEQFDIEDEEDDYADF